MPIAPCGGLMDIMRWGYYSRMRVNDTETVPVKWLRCQPGAKPPPFSHAFGSSRALYVPEMNPDGVGEVYRPRVTGSGFDESPFAGDHVCGGQAYWKNGWPVGTPPLPVDDAGRPLCCGDQTVSVQSVGLSLPSEFLVTGSPVFGTGTLAGVWADEDDHLVLAGPVSGGPGRPRFRGLVPTDLGSGTPSSSTYLRGDGAWATGTSGVVVAPGTNVTVVESPAGTFTVSVPSYPATNISGTLPAVQVGPGYDPADLGSGTLAAGVHVPAAQVGSGYPYADLSGAPTPATIAPGTNVSVVESPAGTFTVSVPSYPATNISGTLPAAQVGSGYPPGDLASGAIASGVTVPPTQLSSGAIGAGVTLAAGQISAGTMGAGVLVPYANVTGAPTAPTLTSNTVSGTATTSPATVLDTGSTLSPVFGGAYVENTGGTTLRYTLLLDFVNGQTETWGPFTAAGAGGATALWTATALGPFSTAAKGGPLTRMRIQLDVASGSTTYRFSYSYVK